MAATENQSDGRKRYVVVGSLLGALLASACCIGPLLLLTLGLTGAWMSTLTALAPYQGYFIATTLALLATGFWLVYIRPRRACEIGSTCASAKSDRIIRIVLWVATAFAALALGVNLALPYFI